MTISGDDSFRQAIASFETGKLNDAERHFKEVLQRQPMHLGALNLLSVLLTRLERYPEAERYIKSALELNSNSDATLYNYGIILKSLKRPNEALERFSQALSLNATVAETWNNRGTVFNDLKRYDDAITDFDKAISLQPNYSEAFCNKGNSLAELKRYEEALTAYEKALELKPNLADAWLGRGNVFCELNLNDNAIEDFNRALAIDPNAVEARFAACFGELRILYTNEHDILHHRAVYKKKLKDLYRDVTAGSLHGDYAGAIGNRPPFFLAYQGQNDRKVQTHYGSLVCHIMQRKFPATELPSLPKKEEPVRVGFISSFFYRHSNWNSLIKGWISQLDRQRFKIFGYHLGAERDSETDVAAAICERFVQRALTVEGWRQEILADKPHVLIYPGLLMDPMSVKLAAQRLAPVQCNSWGHPETSGMPTLDYFVSSDLMEPQDGSNHYSEKLIRLPNLSIYYTPHGPLPTTIFRDNLGLRANSTAFFCGQSLYKYLPQFDDVFAVIAAQSNNCQFVFFEHHGAQQITKQFTERLERMFTEKGLKFADYCVVLPRLSYNDFISAIGQCDVFLDSIGWSGCNTTLESLEHNLPIVTYRGSLMRGRHSVAILSMMGITDTIAHTIDDYISIAVRLANDKELRQELSHRITYNKHRVYHDRHCITKFEEFLNRVGRQKQSPDSTSS
jgi:protein O-GlcNAc transferase